MEKAEIIMTLSNRFRNVNVLPAGMCLSYQHQQTCYSKHHNNLLKKRKKKPWRFWKPRNEILLVETKLVLHIEDALVNKDVEATKHSLCSNGISKAWIRYSKHQVKLVDYFLRHSCSRKILQDSHCRALLLRFQGQHFPMQKLKRKLAYFWILNFTVTSSRIQ